jgi:hypothetical protein
MVVNNSIKETETLPWWNNHLSMLFLNNSLLMWFKGPEKTVEMPLSCDPS